MFRLAILGLLLSRFIDLKGDVPLCEKLLFGTARRMQWITKGGKSGSIRKKTDNNTGSVVLVDQLQ